MRSILGLEAQLDRLAPGVREVARRILSVSSGTATLDPPPEMDSWLAATFGSLEAVRVQRIVRVTNLVTLEGALFNALRSQRPVDHPAGDEVRQTVADTTNDPFCAVETRTPADLFGRVRGRHGISASNVAKYDAFHGVLVFDQHDPQGPVAADVLADHFRTARGWARAAHRTDPTAPYYFLLWNSLWRAGGSIVHGHMQMTLTRGMHYPKVEALRRQARAYAARYGADYFDDLWAVHAGLGLGHEVGRGRIMASLVPIKERELIVLGRPGDDESELAPAIAHGLAALRRAGTVSHNMAIYLPPLAPDGSDWSTFPPVARLVDRGDLASRTSDVGAMELYAASVISADPFRVAEALRA